MFTKWLYTKHLGEGMVDWHVLTELYIFADMRGIVALRRDIMNRFILMRSSDKGSQLHEYDDVARAYACLPESSALRKWIVLTYVHHYRPGLSNLLDEEHRAKCVIAPVAFLFAVMEAQASLLHQIEHSADDRLVGDPGNLGGILMCRCCRDACRFHEHESDEERRASKCSASVCPSDHGLNDSVIKSLLIIHSVRSEPGRITRAAVLLEDGHWRFRHLYQVISLRSEPHDGSLAQIVPGHHWHCDD